MLNIQYAKKHIFYRVTDPGILYSICKMKYRFSSNEKVNYVIS